MKFTIAILLLAFLGLLALAFLLVLDRRADRAEWNRLAALQPVDPERFAPEMVADLPDPARRYFAFMIQPGTPLLPVVEIDMTGQFSLGTKDNPAYQPMEARQILAAPEGFVWAMRTRGGMPVSGSDSGHWTRFRIFDLIPVANRRVRKGGRKGGHRIGAVGWKENPAHSPTPRVWRQGPRLPARPRSPPLAG